MPVGTEVVLLAGRLVSGDRGLFIKESEQPFVEQMAPGEIPAFAERKRKYWTDMAAGKSPGLPSSFRERLGAPMPGDAPQPGPAVSATVSPEDAEDVRTLWIDTDEHGQRFCEVTLGDNFGENALPSSSYHLHCSCPY